MSTERDVERLAEDERTLAEDALAMRALTERRAPGRDARLGLSRRTAERLAARLSEARRLRRRRGVADEALCRLDGLAPTLRACADRAAMEGGAMLPGGAGAPRLLVALRALCAGGAQRLSRERLLSAVHELDVARPLVQAELWAVPEALRVALTEALAEVAGAIVIRARAASKAMGWVHAPSERLPGRGDGFMACALQLAREEGLPEARRRLEALLARRGMAEEAVIAADQAAGAANLLRLENLAAALRMLNALDWRESFERLSRVEAELNGEASGIYARMDEDSRDAVRRALAQIARRLKLPEPAVARAAVDAARGCEGPQGTVCWWLYDDQGREALLERMGRGGARLRRMVPDPAGRRTMAVTAGLATAIAALIATAAGTAWLWPACALLGWACADALAGRFYARFAPPARLLKLNMESVPEDCRTLVTVPALLSGTERVDAVCDQLEALGCLEPDANIEYLLLGDLADAPRQDMPGDGAILSRARARVAAMNARAGREKYAFLCRPRALLQPDGVWMGRDRKRGALMDLNRLLLGAGEGQAAFTLEDGACPRLRGRFAYVVTLDADTRLLAGDVRRLIGAMAHPLNRGYAVLQPRMEPLPSACVNAFARLFTGAGGMNAYPVAASNLWQDMTGTGIYAGKGIYDVASFHARLEGALPEGRVLSHDLIEGALAGAGFVDDVALYDGGPATLASALKRRHRWTRGDWQLLPLLKHRGLCAADRFRMLDNLARSLEAPALLALLLGAVWTGGAGALLAALIVNYLEPLLRPGDGDALKWRRATARLAILPTTAWNALDAVLRTLWRLAVSGKNLMRWVTAADAETSAAPDRAIKLPCRAAALLALPGLLVPGWAPAALALGALFWIAPGWIRDMEAERTGAAKPLSAAARRSFERLAGETWRFFEENVPWPGGALPPDNVQLDPPVGAARRTSPTNIALYLLGCLAARRLGLIGDEALLGRWEATLHALERMEKWRGQLYNWYDIDTLAPLRPRTVSSVDSGNLAAALLACAAARELGGALSARMESLARGMDLAALYDARRELFFIGMDVESGRLSEGRYDLIASEARLLSYVAMMLGQVPTRHWRRLGRACARVGGGVAPLSWSGTMFEYLLPWTLLEELPLTLLGEGVRAATRAQIEQGRRAGRPWGVSESGYCATDAALNYQYHAFGLPSLALDGDARPGVVAPYASMLAAMVEPQAAADNLARMRALGWAGEWGLYEAADYLRPDGEGGPSLVVSHMAHHQGMVLCALCNVLTGDSLRRDFMSRPEARALSLLLEERPGLPGPRRRAEGQRAEAVPHRPRLARRCAPEASVPETQLLSGGGATALCTADGAIHYRRGDLWATRFEGVLQGRRDKARICINDVETGAWTTFGDGPEPAVFEPGVARWLARLGRLEAELTACVSPEDGTLLRLVRLRNSGDRPVRCAVTDVVPVALCRRDDWRAHGVFQSLFVESRGLGDDALCFSRRPGSRGAEDARLLHLAVGPGKITWETDYDKLAGRMDGADPADFDAPLAGGLGATLDPAGALRVELTLEPGKQARVGFALGLPEAGDPTGAWLARWRGADPWSRAVRLAGVRARAELDYLGLAPGQADALQRMAALLADGTLPPQARGSRRGEAGVSREDLWPLGISGDRPILVMAASRPEDGENVRALIRAHGFYRAAGLPVDLALIDDGEPGYARPVGDMLEALVAAGPLNRLRGETGGVWLIDGANLDVGGRRALRRAASAWFAGNTDLYGQIRGLLAALSSPRREPLRPMTVGASTLRPVQKLADNGYGGFEPGEACAYLVEPGPGRLPPAPWCNILANARGGLLLSERGGGFFWADNSRSGRLTPYGNDARREGRGLGLFLVDIDRGELLPLLPGQRPRLPFRARYDDKKIQYAFEARRIAGRVRFAMHPQLPEAQIDVVLENRALRGEVLALSALVDWLMGTDGADRPLLSCWFEDGALLATGAMGGAGYFAAANAYAQSGGNRCAFIGRGSPDAPEDPGSATGEGWALRVPLRLGRGERCALRFVLGWARDVPSARERLRALRSEAPAVPHAGVRGPVIHTPDPALNALANGFLLHQVRASRLLGRTGLYQPGGAWGFRDQLQDMLALMHAEPHRARAHLLRCAAHQFEAGDVMHWWHEPFLGVRTRISDDMLFLPWAVAAYVTHTGDTGVLDERVPYLHGAAIPEDREDLFQAMRPGMKVGTLHDHCMRAFRRAAHTGGHGLLLMGAGDWNDGMNRVGAKGRGESVWLSEFAVACADAYRPLIADAEERAWLWALAERLRRALEAHGWDGAWYLRAYDDAGAPIGGAGSAECRIDAISQAWAVLSGLDGARCRLAMDAAWDMLADEKAGLIRLLTPPFDGKTADPGYIRGYPPGVRENGGQYTHGALWLLLALIRMGDGNRAHRALQMLLPFNHADTPEKAQIYRVEPYVMAADVYDHAGHVGRGGWTWYTGAAGWMYTCILALLGYERRGDRVRLHALLGDWPCVSVTVPFGNSRYRLVCDKKAARVTLDGREVEEEYITMTDDGRDHEARFPRRVR